MFPSFIGILDIQSWWEVPSIAYFCSLFRTAFNLLDFDIEELEEALLTDGSEECASSLLTELIVRLLNGCLGNNDISAFNYQMFLRRLFRQKCQETGRYNPFNTDIDFQFLPLRTKVEILYALCDFRLDGEDVFDLFKNLEAESLRVEPLGWDDKSSAYWYFYGTRLYREDYKQKSKSKKKKREEKRKKQWKCDDWLGDQKERVWQVVCFTEADWTHLTEKFKTATSRVEKELYQSLSENFLPEIPRLFQEKERLQRKRLLELAPRRTSSRVLQKIKQKEEEDKLSEENSKEGTEHFKEEEDKKDNILGREHRAKRRDQLRTQSVSSESSNCSSISEKMSQKVVRRTSKSEEKKSKNSKAPEKGEPPPEAPVKTGRKTNNSLACATGQIVIPDTVESTNSNRKKLKTSQIFSQTEEDIQTDMYKVLEQLTAHEDAWPFMEPVEEEYAPNYYAVIRRPMDLNKMEERLDNGYYAHFAAFEGDFKLIVNNCRLYNGQDNEYTVMVDNLQNAFDKLTERYIHRISSSDEEIAVEYQVPTPSRKHKLKAEPSPTHHGKKKKRTQSGSGDKTGNSSPEREKEISPDNEKPDKESPKVKDGKIKKKRKGHHHHSKHSKSHKKTHDKTSKNYKKEAKHLRKQKHLMKKERSKQRRKKRRHSHKQEVDEVIMKRSNSLESLESPSRSRSASPLPSIHTPSPSPTPSPPPLDHLTDPDFFKDKYDKIKERRRQATKDNWDSLVDYKKSVDPQKQNLSIPEKDKNHKLRETIEKLKAKNEKYKETLMFNNLYNPSCDKSSVSSEPPVQPDTAAFKEVDEYAFTEDRDDNTSQMAKTKKGKGKKATKKVSAAKNESATEALEQAVKDISMWLDDTPKVASHSSPRNSPALTISTEEQDSRLDDDFTGERSQLVKKDSRKRPSSREPKLISKRRELQRTIERLQPGKSKGNLLTNISTAKTEEVVSPGPHNKSREIKSVLTSKTDELSPKLSLGSVLPAVGFTLGKDHKFDETVSKTEEETPKSVPETEPEAPLEDEVLKIEPSSETPTEEKGPEPTASKFSQEKATPNLSAWFKAFGAPKSTHVVKKKNEESEQEERQAENSQPDKPPPSPKNVPKFDSPPDGISPTQEGGDSPVPNVTTTPRQRRTSTGSSISERSSFSQDLDSPRHQITHTSPLLRSPASPRIDEFQKISYPIINGTVRAGFYQDTASIRSSPEKSCSPREGPQSPYSPYSQHVYATNSTGATPNPNYFMDQNRSPLPTYGQIQPLPYYDSSRLVPEASYQASGHMASAYSPGPSPYTQHSQHSPYSHPQHSPYSHPQNSPLSVPHVSTRPHSPAPAVLMPDARTSLYPVKKRTYNEPEISVTAPIQASEKCELKNMTENHNTRNKEEFQQKEAPSSNDMLQTSRDEIVISLSKKSESLKANTSKEKCGMEFMERPSQVMDIPDYSDGAVDLEDKSKLGTQNLTTEKHTDASKGGAIDMVNMGYFVPEPERRSDISDLDLLTALKEMQKLSKPRHLDTRTEPSMKSPNVSNKYGRPTTPEVLGTIEKIQNELHNMCYEKNQSPTDFTLKDVEIASKKVFSGGTVSCNNWNQTRKQDIAHPNYQSGYVRTKSNINIPNPDVSNFNKALHSQQLEAFAGARAPAIRGLAEHNLPSELRIPNPRGMLNKNDLMGQMSMQDNDMLNRNVETSATHKMDKTIQNQPLASSLQYKPPYSNHSSVALDTLQNIPNLPQMLERYTNDERYLSSFSTSSSSLYHEKTLQMAQMFNKSVPSDVHSIGSSASIYSQSTGGHGKDNVSYKASISPNVPSKARRKRATEPKHAQGSGSQTFHTATGTTDPLSSVKTSLVPGSAFNFGPSAGMGLSGSLYSDNSGFSFSNSTANQLMAANYMAAAAAAHQRSTAESNVDKLVKPAHQNSAHTSTGSFPFMGHSQVRAGYPFVGSDPSSPLYQQYFQRHQEEILRQTGAQIMGLYPPGYPASLAARQPYDSINRPSWL